jgi:hypothetical protein
MAAFVVLVLVSVGGGVLLYLAVRSEHCRRESATRDAAERIARRDTESEDREK